MHVSLKHGNQLFGISLDKTSVFELTYMLIVIGEADEAAEDPHLVDLLWSASIVLKLGVQRKEQ